MPKPVRELLRIMHIDQIDVRKIPDTIWQVLSYLKSSEPVLYKRLRSQARASRAHGVVHGAANAFPWWSFRPSRANVAYARSKARIGIGH